MSRERSHVRHASDTSVLDIAIRLTGQYTMRQNIFRVGSWRNFIHVYTFEGIVLRANSEKGVFLINTP